jgi:hypothetical protein
MEADDFASRKGMTTKEILPAIQYWRSGITG